METTHNITERERVEDALRMNELRAEAFLQLNEIAEQSMQMITDFALEKAVELTRSKTGYLALVNADETLLTMQSWPKAAAEQRDVEVAPHTYSLAEHGQWAEAVRQRRPVIANEDAPPRSLEDAPPRAVEVVRHMDVPVFDGERIVAVAGVGNKETPYDENDVRQLKMLMVGMWRLVQRKQGEDRLRATAEALRRSEAYLAEAQKLTHTGSWAGDGAMRALYWSRENYRIFEFDPQQGLPTRDQLMERIHPDDRDRVLQAFETVVHQKVESQAEYRIVHPDGTVKYAHSIAHPVLNANGELLEVLGTTVDVTDRKRAEEALALTSFALNHAHDGAALLDEQGRILYVNDESCRQSGFTRDELLAMFVWDVNPDFTAQKWSEHWQTLKTRQSVTFESCHLTKGGGTIPVEISARYVEYEGTVFNVAIVRDITDRKRAEEALRRSESYLADAQKLTHSGSWVWDPHRDEMQHCSDETFRIFGFDPQEGVSAIHQFLERVHPDDRSRVREDSLTGALGKTDHVLDYRIVLPDGTLKHVHSTRHPVVNDSGEVVEVVGTLVDVSERKRAEEALRRSESYLAEAQRMARTGSWADNGSPVYWSEEHYRIFGLDPQQGLPSREQVIERIHPDDRRMVLQAFESASVRKADGEAYYRIAMPDGTVKYAHGIGHPVLDDAGNVVEIVGTTIDITERKRTEEALTRSEKLFRAIAETAPMIIILWTKHDKTDAYFNPGIYRLTGYSPEELPNVAAWWLLAYPDPVYRKSIANEWQSRIARAIATRGSIEPMEAEVTCKDGSKKYISWGFVSTGEQNISFGIDLTRRKRTEEALRRSEAYLAEAQRLTHTGSWAGVSPLRPAYWSEEHYRIFGFDPRQGLPGREQPVERIHPDDRDRVIQAFERLRQKADCEVEYRIVLPDGTIKHTHGIGHPVLDVNGNVVELVGTTVDITARKRYEEERARLHHLEADLAHINRVSMMGELTASIAHEVNQPLSGVVSNGSACLRWLAGDTPNVDEAREAARRIVRDGKRAAEIITRIRALTKKTLENRERLDLNETIREVLPLVGNEAKKNSVDIRTSFSEEIFPVIGDRVQLQQLVLNLLMNALEAMSTITDRPRELVITSQNADQDCVEVTIQDSGIGLDPDQSARIFDAFYTTKPTGMGMGLSISRSILHAHGGRLWATANDGPGTTFHFTLPKEQDEGNAERARA